MLGWSQISNDNIILPLGISFFTFQTMSYTIDIYRQQIKPAQSIFYFASYVAMFPQLIAGPVVRFSEVQHNLIRPYENINYIKAFHFFSIGFIKKVLIANNFEVLATYAYRYDGGDFLTSVCGLFSFSMQLYFDFSGYSDMAIGLGFLFGFNFPYNFNSPYKASSITDFWKRWHITLSQWFKDYLYIPLGGNKKGNYRTLFNLVAVMLICGLWHGASWNFLIWGGLHGIFLLIERLFRNKELFTSKLHNSFKTLYTFIIVSLLWIPFKESDLLHSNLHFQNIFNFTNYKNSLAYDLFELHHLILILVSIVIVFFTSNSQQLSQKINFKMQVWQLLVFVIAIHEMLGQNYKPHIYFNF
jgi:alginate O-acetyltransferase complex protein AlgI